METPLMELAKQLRAELAIARSSLDTVERERESRIAALTAELEQAKAYAAKADEALLDCATAHATERAAREQAEKQLAHTEDLLLGTADSARNWEEMCEQAERERDAALARWGSQQDTLVATLAKVGDLTARVKELEAALASARELIERARAWLAWPTPAEPGPEPAVCLLNALESWLSSAPSPAPCYGCAAARELLVTADEPYSVVQWRIERDSWLKERP